MPSPSLESALVRLLINNQEPRCPEGAGFLVTPNHILTCAHVVNDALGRNRDTARANAFKRTQIQQDRFARKTA